MSARHHETDTTPVRRGDLERLERENAALRALLERALIGADERGQAALLQEFRQYRAQYTGHPQSWSPLADEDPPG